ncbi:hypothetical protein L218DRAFT_989072 [Marasmius fiardii PR-910]|nr:hypothetical protein L218DRAFT_989072 [Marasmius fiardii PR-910]
MSDDLATPPDSISPPANPESSATPILPETMIQMCPYIVALSNEVNTQSAESIVRPEASTQASVTASQSDSGLLAQASATGRSNFELEEHMNEYETPLLPQPLNHWIGHRLPTELLVQIFTYCVKDRNLNLDMRIKRKSLSFTQVCRRWRAIALNAPSLWTLPHFYHKDLAREMIKRARNLPLVIEGHISRTTSRDMKSAVVQAASELSRTRKLQLQAPSSIDMERILANFTRPAPMLTLLDLCAPPAGNEFTLPSNFLGGTTPNLTYLSLTGCSLIPNSPLLRNVTVLKLDLSNFCLPFSFAEFKTILVTSSNLLEHLELRVWELIGDPDAVIMTSIHRLPKLQYLYLECEV